MENEITPEIMQQIVDELVKHDDYDEEKIEIIGTTIVIYHEDATIYFAVTFEEVEEWNYKLQYQLTEPYVYLKEHAFPFGDNND